MSRPVRAATVAALSFCALFASYSAPSFADDRVGQNVILTSLSATANPYALKAPSLTTPAMNGTTAIPFPQTNAHAAGSLLVEPQAPASAASLTSLVSQNQHGATADRDEECLAGAVYFEAKSETLEGQLAVAEVIRNRADSGRFPSSYCGVVLQKSQFSFVRNGDLPPINKDSSAWRRAVAVAKIASAKLWESVGAKALFFHASHVSPGWRNLTKLSRIGNHVFYR